MSDEEKIQYIKEVIRLKGVDAHQEMQRLSHHDKKEIKWLRGMSEAYDNAVDIITREWRNN